MKTEPCHEVCESCEYRAVCFPLLKFMHRIVKICKQGRKQPVRVKPKDQATLPITPEDTEVEESCG